MKYWVPQDTKVHVYPAEAIQNLPLTFDLVGERMVRTAKGVMYDEKDLAAWDPDGEKVLKYKFLPIGEYYVFRIPTNPYGIEFIIVDSNRVRPDSTDTSEVPQSPRENGAWEVAAAEADKVGECAGCGVSMMRMDSSFGKKGKTYCSNCAMRIL